MAWSVLQSAGGASDTAPSATYTGNVSSGTKLIAAVTCFDATTTAVKDGALNSFTKLASVLLNNSTAAGELSLWAIDTPAGDVGTKPVITPTLSAGTVAGVVIQEVSGLLAGNTSAMLDGSAGTHFGSIASNGNVSCGTYSSAAANEYLVALYGDDEFSNNTAGTPTGTATYTLDSGSQQANGIENCSLAYGNSGNGSETATFAITGVTATSDVATILVAFQLAAGGAAPPPVQQARPGKTWLRRFPAGRRNRVSAPPSPLLAPSPQAPRRAAARLPAGRRGRIFTPAASLPGAVPVQRGVRRALVLSRRHGGIFQPPWPQVVTGGPQVLPPAFQRVAARAKLPQPRGRSWSPPWVPPAPGGPQVLPPAFQRQDWRPRLPVRKTVLGRPPWPVTVPVPRLCRTAGRPQLPARRGQCFRPPWPQVVTAPPAYVPALCRKAVRPQLPQPRGRRFIPPRPPAPVPQPCISRRQRHWAYQRRGRWAGVAFPGAPPPPFTIGVLTAATAATAAIGTGDAAVSTLTAGTAAQGTLTAGTATAGGPS